MSEIEANSRIRAYRSEKIEVINQDLTDAEYPARNIAEIENWDNIPTPEVPDGYRANLTIEELIEEIKLHCGLDYQADEPAVLGPLIIYAGVHPQDTRARQWMRIGVEFSPATTFAYSAVEMYGRRMPMRAIPGSWQNHPQLRTAFIMRGSNYHDGIDIFYNDGNDESLIGSSQTMLPLDSPRVLSYMRSNRGSGPNLSITINPIQTCPIRCQFCYRGYDRINGKDGEVTENVSLISLRPDQMADHLITKFSGLDFSQLQQISLLSGAFPHFDALYKYITHFVAVISARTHGEFDPIRNSHQNIHMLTHLARSADKLQALKAAGVKTLQDTVEIIDDQTRKRVMPKANPRNVFVVGKADDSFGDILQVIPDGVRIYGDGYSVTAIIGLDDYETTVAGLRALKGTGLRSLAYPTFQPYGIKDMGLYKMDFSQIMNVRRRAASLFARVH